MCEDTVSVVVLHHKRNPTDYFLKSNLIAYFASQVIRYQ